MTYVGEDFHAVCPEKEHAHRLRRMKIQCFKGPWYDSFQSLPSGGGSKHFFVVIKTILDQDETSFHPSYLVKNNFQCGSTTPDPPPQIQHGRPKVQIWFK